MILQVTTSALAASELRCGDIIRHAGVEGGAADVRTENGEVRFNIGHGFTRYTVKASDSLALIRRPMFTNRHHDGKPFANPFRK